MKNNIVFSFLLFIIISSGGYLLYQNNQIKIQLSKPDLSHLGGDFQLQSSTNLIKLSQFKGSLVLLYFGFTSCPDVCPLALHSLNKTLDQLSLEKRNQIVKIFISVDWKRDTPEKVEEYTKFFADDFIGLTGSEKEINKITKQYAAYFKFIPLEDSELDYTVDHSSRFYLIDREGKLVSTYSDIVNDPNFIKELTSL